MSKPTRRSATPQPGRTVKTSVPLDVGIHSRLCALASMRGVPIAAILAEAAAVAVRGIVVIDRRNSEERANSNVQGKGSAASSPELDIISGDSAA